MSKIEVNLECETFSNPQVTAQIADWKSWGALHLATKTFYLYSVKTLVFYLFIEMGAALQQSLVSNRYS